MKRTILNLAVCWGFFMLGGAQGAGLLESKFPLLFYGGLILTGLVVIINLVDE